MRKLLLIMLSMIVLLTTTGFAFDNTVNNNNSYQEYAKLVEDGVLEEISFEEWLEIRALDENLALAMENSDEFELVYDSTASTYGAVSPYSMMSGDVFITNGTSSAGFLGHAGIAISTSQILHIAGPNTSPTRISLSSWHSQYTNKASDSWTKVYRHSSTTTAAKAGSWANTTYGVDSEASYVINFDLTSTDKTYCSKIVWQAYYYGPTTAVATGSTIGVVTPYDLPNRINGVTNIWYVPSGS